MSIRFGFCASLVTLVIWKHPDARARNRRAGSIAHDAGDLGWLTEFNCDLSRLSLRHHGLRLCRGPILFVGIHAELPRRQSKESHAICGRRTAAIEILVFQRHTRVRKKFVAVFPANGHFHNTAFVSLYLHAGGGFAGDDFGRNCVRHPIGDGFVCPNCRDLIRTSGNIGNLK